MTKEEEIMDFLHQKVFDPVLQSKTASESVKKGIRYTVIRLNERNAEAMIKYFWSAIVGTEKSTKFAKLMKEQGFNRFEEVIDEFRDRFDNNWINK
ncbi:hypothetical protein [Psychrobacillus sp. FJAT-21963]|uniref:hypothetical protein n=1 Tax=Psychrobacillus sp. FJAT-21963 TaxID=1712028 RepID=UPI0006FB87B7|nr:hypothetical protein [Psychrobacillus sp. FJAT-21963]KQL33365.1 hypothetical protein AN959_17560 [Psychrobacillus sp. FJAT-21963]